MKSPRVKSLLVSAGTILIALAALMPAQADYSTTVAALNPVGYWRLNEPAASSTAVNIGSAGALGNATYIGSPALQQPGAMGTDPAALFNGADQYASVPYNAAFNPSGSFTVGFWANKTGTDNSGTKGAIFSRDPASSGQNGWLFFAGNGDGKWWFRTYTGNVRANAISTSPILLNQWTHVVGVHDAADTGTNYLYVNGVLAAAPVGNAGYTPNASFPMFFAAWANTGTDLPEFFFPGLLDEIAFFDKALTPAQIHDLYVAAEYPPRIVEQPSAPSKIYEGDPAPITLSVVVENTSATPATYQWTKDGINIPGATTASLALGVVTVGASGNYAVVVSNPNGSVTSVVVPISVVPSPPGRVDYAHTVLSLKPVAYYRLNDAANATTTANAGSWGAGADGAYKPGATGGAPGVPYPGFGAGNYGTLFAGIAGLRDGAVGDPDTPGSGIRIPAQSGIVEDMTITCWVKRNGDHWVWRGLVTQRDSDSGAPNGAGNGTGLTLGANGSSPNVGQELRILWNKGDVYWQYDPGLNTPNQQWAFCAVVFTPTNRTVYLNTHAVSNTVPPDETTMPAGPHDWSVNPIFIGYDARGPYYGENSAFNGAMDEVAIFDRALTTNEMMQLYAAAEVPPVILVQPQAPPPPVYEGMAVSLSVVADELASTSPLHYQWTRNGIPISGQTATNFAISTLATTDTANYAVVITNTYGAVTSSVVALTVLSGPPIIAQQPQSIQRFAGGTATFRVTAFGSVPLSYQWSFNGTPISGATSSAYTLTEVGAGDAGDYSVLVTNPYGNTNSANAALTLLTATKLAAAVTDLAPLAYWRLDETSGMVAYDYWGGRDGTRTPGAANNAEGPSPTSTPTPCLGFDAANKAYSLNNGWVSVPPLKLNTHTVTMIAWVNPVDVSGGHHGIVFSKTGQDAPDGCGLDWWNGGLLEYQWNSARRDNPESGLYVISGQWNFVALVVEPHQGTIYLDDGNGGGLQSFSNPADNGLAQFGGELRLGSDVQDNRNFIGLIDDVAIFDRALSAAEIENIRKAGVNGIYAPAPVSFVSQPQSQTVFVGSDISFAPVVSGSQPISYQWQKGASNIPGATRETLAISNAYYTDAGTYRLAVTNSLGGRTSQNVTLTVVPLPTFGNLTNDLVLHLKFDGDCADASGRANHGTAVGAPTFVAGKIGSNAVRVASEADVTVDPKVVTSANYVTLDTPADLQFGAEVDFTVAYWMKVPVGEKYTEFPVLCNSVNGTYNPGLYFGTDWNTRGGGFTWWLGGAQAGKVFESPADTINDGNWHHLVFSFDRAGEGVTYLDGAQVDTRSISGGGDVDVPGQAMNIGQDSTGTYPWFAEAGPRAEAVVDDLGIWRRALSPTEAQSIYLVGQTYGRTFDTYGPVTLTVQRSEAEIELIWQAGTLEAAAEVTGAYLPVPGAAAPYQKVQPSAARKFYRVRL